MIHIQHIQDNNKNKKLNKTRKSIFLNSISGCRNGDKCRFYHYTTFTKPIIDMTNTHTKHEKTNEQN